MTAPVRDIRMGDRIIRRQPPVIVHWCRPPTRGHANDPECVFRNASCNGPTITCSTCHYPRCQVHDAIHRKHLTFPADIWVELVRRMIAWHRVVGADPSKRPRVAIQMPEESDG
jgi:hypothetical protein